MAEFLWHFIRTSLNSPTTFFPSRQLTFPGQICVSFLLYSSSFQLSHGYQAQTLVWVRPWPFHCCCMSRDAHNHYTRQQHKWRAHKYCMKNGSALISRLDVSKLSTSFLRHHSEAMPRTCHYRQKMNECCYRITSAIIKSFRILLSGLVVSNGFILVWVQSERIFTS